MIFRVLFQFCVVFYSVFNCCFAQEFKYKVIAPKYICIKQNMSQTAIRLIGEDVPNLKYNWTVDFRLLETKETGNLKQRHVLMVWTSVRTLENILQNISKEDLNLGIIYFNNSLLTSDVKYIINVSAEKQVNNTIKRNKKLITIEYIENTNKSTLTISVSGPEMTFFDMTYTAKAEISSCNDSSNYQLSWQVLDESKKIIKNTTTKSNTLHIMPGTFLAGNKYFIKCSVFDTVFNKSKNSDVLTINVLERGMQLSTYTKQLKIGIKQSIYLNAFFNDPDSIAGQLTFSWECLNSSNDSCTAFESNNNTELIIPKGLPIPGRYLFTVTATKDSKNVNDSSVVDIVEELVPIIDIENAVTFCNSKDAVKISAHVSRLVPECSLQWISVNLTEFEYIDLENVPGKPGNLVNLTEDDENIFSSEESNNETFIDIQHDFLLPASQDGSWIGLKSGSKYLFRLIVLCPCEENNSSSDSESKFVTSSADVEVKINKSPILKSLKVNPNSGQALLTKFNFKTAEPDSSTNPLLYKYGFLNKYNNSIYLSEQYDTTSVETILPFYDDPIQTILEVCDSKNSCNSTFGPKVIVKIPNNLSEIEINTLLNDFNKLISEQNYFSAFTLSSIILQSAGQLKPNTSFDIFDTSIKNVTRQEINIFNSAEDDDSWLLPASELLKHIKILDNYTFIPEDILNDIIALRDKISEKQNSISKKQSKSEKLVAILPPSRKLLSLQINKKSKRIVNEINIEEIKNYLEISELAIKRFTDFERVDNEKQKLRQKLQSYMPRICQFLYNNYKTNVRIELSTLVFDVEKINLVRKYNNIISIPFDMNLAAKLQIGRELADKYRRKKGTCLGKILFIDDYFNIPQFVYDIKLYAALSEKQLGTEINNFAITIEMPVKSTVSNNQIFQCVIWENEDNNWDMTKCKTIEEFPTSVKCVCRSLGYLSIVPVERTTTLTTRSTTTTSGFTLKTSSTLDLFTQYDTRTTRLTTVYNSRATRQPYHATIVVTTTREQLTSTENNGKNSKYQAYQSNNKSINAAGVWSISLLSVGIASLILASLILLRKLQRFKTVQSFQSIEYAKYFDEHNLE